MIPNKLKIYLPVSIFVVVGVFLAVAQTTQAFSLPNLIEEAKSFLSPPKKELKIESNISLAPEGDVNKNGQIDAGDIVRFSYTLTNTTDQEYSFATLKTNINRKQLNFIHNITGTSDSRYGQ